MISILIPVKNAAAFLSDCVFSVLQQTETDWEAIFVDDHSTDTSLEILEAIAKHFTQIKVYTSKGTGIIPALQTAYKHASGQFITRMDADDKMPPDKLQLLKTKLQTLGPGHVVTGKVEYFSATKLGQGYLNYQSWLNDLSEHNSHYQDLYKECVIPSAGFMVHRDDFDQIGAFDSPYYPEDYDLVFRFYQGGLKVVGLPEVVHLWRDHADRISRNSPIYAGHFFDLKLHYFLLLDYDPSKNLVLIGAGKKGKQLAQKLINKNISFTWLTNNSQKIGKEIYQKFLKKEDISSLELDKNQLIIAISSPSEVIELNKELVLNKFKKGYDYFWFC